jgi:hypothetical protein
VQIAAYNFHLGLLRPEPFWLEQKVYSDRCEADVLMSSPTGDYTKAKAAYQDFFALWKDADPDIPILKQAKAEYAKLQ